MKGEFAKPGQTDWAVLCGSKKGPVFLVFWNGLETRPSELEVIPNVAFYWIIAPAGKDVVTKDRAPDGPELPTIDHQGIALNTDSQSAMLYYSQGKWVTVSRITTKIY